MNAYVLIGGRSRRMGESKAALELGGRSFLERIGRAAGAAFDEVLLIDQFGREGEPGPWKRITEHEHRDSGAIFGLRRALEHAGGNPLWLLGVDYPLLSAGLLSELRSRFEQRDEEMVVPVVGGQPQWLCAGYRGGVARTVDMQIEARDYRLQSLARDARVFYIDAKELDTPDAAALLSNVNEPADLAGVRRFHGQAHSPR